MGLKPCSSCGNIKHIQNYRPMEVNLSCPECGYKTGWYREVDNAIDEWNNRKLAKCIICNEFPVRVINHLELNYIKCNGCGEETEDYNDLDQAKIEWAGMNRRR